MEGTPATLAPSDLTLKQKISLIAIVAMFITAVALFCCYICHVFLRGRPRLNFRTPQLAVSLYPAADAARSSGLDPDVLELLPVFVFPSATVEKRLECSVCLSEFEEGEEGRLLPSCRHSFHKGCIDRWFQSHTSCPLCRCAMDSKD